MARFTIDSMAHLGPQRIWPGCDEWETNGRPAMWTLRTDGLLVEQLILIGFQPHELETFRTATDLR